MNEREEQFDDDPQIQEFARNLKNADLMTDEEIYRYDTQTQKLKPKKDAVDELFENQSSEEEESKEMRVKRRRNFLADFDSLYDRADSKFEEKNLLLDRREQFGGFSMWFITLIFLGVAIYLIQSYATNRRHEVVSQYLQSVDDWNTKYEHLFRNLEVSLMPSTNQTNSTTSIPQLALLPIVNLTTLDPSISSAIKEDSIASDPNQTLANVWFQANSSGHDFGLYLDRSVAEVEGDQVRIIALGVGGDVVEVEVEVVVRKTIHGYNVSP